MEVRRVKINQEVGDDLCVRVLKLLPEVSILLILEAMSIVKVDI